MHDAWEHPTSPGHLSVPREDVADPELSIVVPALDEELTIAEFVDWCHRGLVTARVAGEILIVDSSTDRTPEIALAHGARVLRTARRGLGHAYIEALPYIRGRYVLMGDADCTYDFRELGPFVDGFREGREFIMGSRWLGRIEPGSMPALHRYLGTPLTTWALNVLYASRFTDIHCGMRGITRDALRRMDLRSESWEYASEMVLKSVHMGLRTREVPVRFHRDRHGRLSHHRRVGWWSPFQAGWVNLRAMLVHGAEFFSLRPGVALLVAGMLLCVPLSLGPFTVGRVHLSLHWMLLGVTLTLLGLQCFQLGCLAQVLHDHTGAASSRWLRLFPYTRTVALCGVSCATGFALALGLLVHYLRAGLALADSDREQYLGVLGLLLMLVGFATFTFVLLLHAAVPRSPYAHGRPATGLR